MGRQVIISKKENMYAIYILSKSLSTTSIPSNGRDFCADRTSGAGPVLPSPTGTILGAFSANNASLCSAGNLLLHCSLRTLHPNLTLCIMVALNKKRPGANLLLATPPRKHKGVCSSDNIRRSLGVLKNNIL